jgi:squalene cyclase
VSYLQINVSRSVIIVSRSQYFWQINLSRKREFLRAEVLAFASYYTYMTRVEGENTRLRHYLARLHRETLCYSKSIEMLKYSIRLLLNYLKFKVT